MTLILAIKCKDGIVMASDGQATGISTGGPIRQKCKKIFKLSNNVLLGASGTFGVIQRCRDSIKIYADKISSEGINSLIEEKTSKNKVKMITVRDKIREIIFSINKVEKERHKTFYEKERGAPLADILLAFYDPKEDMFRIWHVAPDGGEEFLDELGYGCSGVGDTFAYTFLKNYYKEDLKVKQGKIIAYRVIKDAIEVGAYGLGEPIDIWILKRGKNNIINKELSQEELMGLEDTYRAWREFENKVFRKIWGEEDGKAG